MTQTTGPNGLSDQFNAFLRYGLWPDRDAAPLSILSALARLDVDPWEEAASLSALPESSACAKLAAMLANLPGRPAMRQELDALCAMSVRLLPREADGRQGFTPAPTSQRPAGRPGFFAAIWGRK